MIRDIMGRLSWQKKTTFCAFIMHSSQILHWNTPRVKISIYLILTIKYGICNKRVNFLNLLYFHENTVWPSCFILQKPFQWANQGSSTSPLKCLRENGWFRGSTWDEVRRPRDQVSHSENGMPLGFKDPCLLTGWTEWSMHRVTEASEFLRSSSLASWHENPTLCMPISSPFWELSHGLPPQPPPCLC